MDREILILTDVSQIEKYVGHPLYDETQKKLNKCTYYKQNRFTD